MPYRKQASPTVQASPTEQASPTDCAPGHPRVALGAQQPCRPVLRLVARPQAPPGAARAGGRPTTTAGSTRTSVRSELAT